MRERVVTQKRSGRRRGGALLLLLVLGACGARAEDTNTVVTLEALVRQWVDLRGAMAREANEWTEQQRQWQMEIGLLEREKADLQAELQSAADVQQSAGRDQLALTERRDRLRAVEDGLRPVLERAEADLLRWRRYIPATLMAPLEEGYRQLPNTPDEAARMSLSRRLQLAVALYTQLEGLQHDLHTVREILPDGAGGRREVDVLYLGLARGYAVSPDASWAAVGSPGPGGWQWDPRPAVAGAVRAAVAVQRRDEIAQVVPLPVKVVDVTP